MLLIKTMCGFSLYIQFITIYSAFKSVQYLNNYIMYKLLFYGRIAANDNIKTRYFWKIEGSNKLKYTTPIKYRSRALVLA